MLLNLLKKLRRDRRGATAMVVALMIVPLILVCGAAVDFSRVSSARTQLQAAVDAAAVAGDGTYQTDQSSVNALNVATSTFKSDTLNLTAYSAVGAPTVTPTCQASPSGACTATNANYSVTVKASATLKNSLLGLWIPSDALSATAIASSSTSTNGNCPSATSHCVHTAGTVSLTPGGSGGGLIFSANHLAGTGAPESNPPNNNPGGAAEKFNIFLNGNNNAVPGIAAYVPPTQNATDPCPANPKPQTIQPDGDIYDVNNNDVRCQDSGICNLPAGTYCGNLTIGANVTLTLTSTMSNPGVYINDGNLLVSPNATIVCNAASGYSSQPPPPSNCNTANIASQFVPIYFGGTNAGSIIVEQTTTIDPSQIASGNIEYISTFNSVNTQNNGVSTQLQAGVCQDAASYCTSGAIGGPMTIVFSNAGTITYNDTYITNITITSGIETHWAQTEILAAEFKDGSGNIINNCANSTNNTTNQPCIFTQTVTYGGDQTLSGGNTVDSNLQSSSMQTSSYNPSTVMPSSTLTCSSGQQLYYGTTTGTGSGANPNLGYSYAGQNISGDGLLAETINICGVGTALASNGGSGTGTTVGPSGTSTSPILVY